ncbi:DUF3596 domain-containing protein [Oxalobacter formigenes]|nr:DUF3596 domain-containing protein [Oxalobacter formigenes]
MGGKRERSGVVAVSETSIQITFTFKGVLCRERLKLKPTAANLKRAELHRAAILHAISIGTFDYSVTFPDSPRRFKFSEEKGDGHFWKIGFKHGLTAKSHISKPAHGMATGKLSITY